MGWGPGRGEKKECRAQGEGKQKPAACLFALPVVPLLLLFFIFFFLGGGGGGGSFTHPLPITIHSCMISLLPPNPWLEARGIYQTMTPGTRCPTLIDNGSHAPVTDPSVVHLINLKEQSDLLVYKCFEIGVNDIV